MVNIFLVRHGETLANLNKVNYIESEYNGLTQNGINQAKSTALILADVIFDICYCSPLARAIETANEIIKLHPNLKVLTDSRIVERRWGDLEGKKVELGEPNRWYRYKQFNHANVETVDEMFERIQSFYGDIKLRHPGQNVLVVAHSGVNRVTRCYLDGFPVDGDLSSFGMSNADCVKFTI